MSDESNILPPLITQDRERRERTLDTVQGQTIQSIVATSPASVTEALLDYQAFLSDKVDQAWLYAQTNSPSLSQAVAADVTAPWLDNVTSSGLTIRAEIIAQLASPVE